MRMVQIDSRVWAGSEPSKEDYKRLLDEGFTIISLTRTNYPFELHRLNHIHIPMSDRKVSKGSIKLAYKAVQYFRREGNVYIHCKAGRNRSGQVILYYLIKRGYDIDEALEKLESLGFRIDRYALEEIRELVG